ncbi:PREDICTED: complex III assembly factor LYRM7 isoform X2 [Wasmannia auropunctata]|uniref:complex III assembly factor LYRM7 isoform X2 n=1 Tax=Wasmannia auropunctata TaxID=64793 RepID=UPI0005EEC756|nr:PREDICTED: complex III assembly factor LYRM7 isoform X2 [Wasmannia auropunctata]
MFSRLSTVHSPVLHGINDTSFRTGNNCKNSHKWATLCDERLIIVLQVFKKLHRTRLKTFEVVRDKINKEYRKYKNVTNQAAIEELNKFAQEVEHEVRTTVIQAIETAPGRVALRLTPDVLVDNVPYKDQKDNKKDNKSGQESKN